MHIHMLISTSFGFKREEKNASINLIINARVFYISLKKSNIYVYL